MSASGRDAQAALDKMAAAQGRVSQSGGILSSTLGKLTAGFTIASLIDRGISSVIKFGSAALESASHITDLADKTGLSTKSIQQMMHVAEQTGTTVDAFSQSAYKLGISISGGKGSVRGALDDLHLSWQQVKGMGLDEQWEKVTAALGAVANAQERNRIGAELMGKGFSEIAPAIAEGYQSIAKEAKIAGDEQVRAADRAGDAWAKFKRDFAASTTNLLGNVILNFERSSRNDQLFRMMQGDTRGLTGADGATPGIGFSGSGDKSVTGQNFSGASFINLPAEAAGGPAESLADALAKARKELAGLTEEQKKNIRAGLDLSKSMDDISKATGISEEVIGLYKDQLTGSAEAAKKLAAEQKKLNDELDKMFGLNHAAGEGVVGAYGGIGQQMILQGVKVHQAQLQLTATGLGATPWQGRMALLHGFQPTVETYGALPRELHAGPPGFFQSVGSGIGGTFKNLIGGMTGGNGAAGLLTNIGSGVLSGGLNSLMNLAIGGITKGLGKLFGIGGEGKKTNTERDSKLTEFTGISDLRGAQDQMRKLASEAGVADSQLQQLFGTKKVKDFETQFKSVTDKIKQFTDEQSADQERLTAALQKYGFSFAEIGQQLQGKQIADQAKELIEDWRVLAGAGIDVATVNEKMADSINQFLQTAISVGAEVPGAMRPILQSLIDQGKLFDASGNKIEDLQAAGVTFSETLTQGFDRVVQKLDELIARLGIAGAAISNLPTPSMPDFAPPDQADFAMPMARGGSGRVTGPTLFLAGEAGAEDVAFSGANKRFGGSDFSALVREIRGLRREMPRVIKDAVAGV
jgi:DNA-binding transcriptional MerR regulator